MPHQERVTKTKSRTPGSYGAKARSKISLVTEWGGLDVRTAQHANGQFCIASFCFVSYDLAATSFPRLCRFMPQNLPPDLVGPEKTVVFDSLTSQLI